MVLNFSLYYLVIVYLSFILRLIKSRILLRLALRLALDSRVFLLNLRFFLLLVKIFSYEVLNFIRFSLVACIRSKDSFSLFAFLLVSTDLLYAPGLDIANKRIKFGVK